MCMTSAKYQPLELDDEEEHCVKICYEIILEDSPEKVDVENCIEWLDLIIEPLEYVNKNDNAPMMDRLKL